MLHGQCLVDRQLFAARVKAQHVRCCDSRAMNISDGLRDQLRPVPTRFGYDVPAGLPVFDFSDPSSMYNKTSAEGLSFSLLLVSMLSSEAPSLIMSVTGPIGVP